MHDPSKTLYPSPVESSTLEIIDSDTDRKRDKGLTRRHFVSPAEGSDTSFSRVGGARVTRGGGGPRAPKVHE